jgi:hypothetical protein
MPRRQLIFSLSLSLLFLLSNACSNFLVTPKASTDGSTLIAYNADSDSLYGTMGHYPAGIHTPGEMVSGKEICDDWIGLRERRRGGDRWGVGSDLDDTFFFRFPSMIGTAACTLELSRKCESFSLSSQLLFYGIFVHVEMLR